MKRGKSFSGGMEGIRMILCAVCMITGASAKLLVLPQNSVVISGEQAKLECQTDGEHTRLLWQRDLPTSVSQKEKIVYSGYEISADVASFCKLSTDSVGKFSLQISGFDVAAQRYICIEPGTLENGSAELIVLETDPICTDHSDSDYINATCTIVAHGNWRPEMHWKLNGADIQGNLMYLNKSLTSRLTLPRNMTSYSISCMTNFSLRLKPGMTTAKNVPSYTKDWRSTGSAPAALTDSNNVAIAVCFPLLAVLIVCGIVIFSYRCYQKHVKGHATQMPVTNSHDDDEDQAEQHSLRTQTVLGQDDQRQDDRLHHGNGRLTPVVPNLF